MYVHLYVVLQSDSDFTPTLFRLSDETGTLERTVVAEGELSRSYLDPKDGEDKLRPLDSTCWSPTLAVFIADTGKACFVWIGSGASEAENKNAMPNAHVRTCTCTCMHPLTFMYMYIILFMHRTTS